MYLDSGPIGYNELKFNTGTFNNNPADPTNDLRQHPGCIAPALGPPLPQNVLADVVVQGIDADNYQINFGDASSGQWQPLYNAGNTPVERILCRPWT